MNGTDKYGRVYDVKLAKRIIIQWLYTYKDIRDDIQEFIDEVQNSLYEFDGGFFIDDGKDRSYFGGPCGDSGLCIYTLASRYQDHLDCPSVYGAERDINAERIVVIDNNGSPEVFVIHEYD